MAISFFKSAGCEVDKIDILSTIRTTKPPEEIGWKKKIKSPCGFNFQETSFHLLA